MVSLIKNQLLKPFSMSNTYCAVIVSLLLCSYHVSDGITTAVPVKTRNGDFAFPDEVQFNNNSKQSYTQYYHQHHYHGPDFHGSHLHGTERDHSTNTRPINNFKAQEIPLDFAYDINTLKVNDLLLNYVEGLETDEPVIQDRFGDDQEHERKAVLRPQKAGCIPELRTVKIASSDDPSILYIPQCTRIERCGGCCSHSLLSCQPQEIEYVNYEVYKTQYTGGKKLKGIGKEIVVVEKHTKCKCDCRIKPEDCSKFQEYRKSECRCACVNYDEEKKCYKNNVRKLWDPNSCTCQCRETLQCSTGSYFDQNDCKCKTVPPGVQLIKNERNFKRNPVISFDENP